ncbi:SdrD B-like domain-containing protein [Rudanella paleaurantiibacter]|uniref:SdrD B-like domain-containing protein n=1 Tax=Rudanella paleaurantiibacter TaxID=2614655 RepID=UPI0016282BF2|nr:SdrD B-like domain-containing protein [Rudanella paleaurantiibacter]
MSSSTAQAQTLELTAESNKTDILTGETLVYTFKYKCASTTNNCTGVTLTATIPQNIVFPTQTIGLPSDILSYSISPSGNSITFTLKEPLTAGNTGIIQVTGQGVFGLADNSTATLTAVLASNGVPGSTQTVNTTLHSSDKFCPQISTPAGFALDNTTLYRTQLGFVGNNYGSNGIGTVNPGPITFLQQFPAGTQIQSVEIKAVDGLPLPVIPANAYTIDNTNANVTVNLPASTMQIISAYAPVVEIQVRVIYPSSVFATGTSVTSDVTVTYQPDGVATPIVVTNGSTKTYSNGTVYSSLSTGTCTNTLSNTSSLASPVAMMNAGKSSNKSLLKPGENSYYTIGLINTGNTALTDVVIEDIIPSADITVTSINRAFFANLGGDEIIRYFVKTVNNPTYTEILTTSNAYGPTAGDVITAIKITADKFPAGATTGGSPIYINFTLNATSTATSVQNCLTATASNTSLVFDPATSLCATFAVQPLDQFSSIGVNKLYTKSANDIYNLFYSENVNATTPPFWSYLRAQNLGGGQPLQNPAIMDLLPVGLDFTNQIIYSSGTPPASTTEVIPNFNGTGRTLIRFSWSSPMPSGATYGVNIGVKVNALAPAGPGSQFTTNDQLYNPYLETGGLKNTAYFTGSSTHVCNVPQYYTPEQVGVADVYDLNSNGVKSETLCYGSAILGVTSAAQLSSVKWVKGQCDTEYSRYPDFGQTVPGGMANYKLIVTNTGNVPTTSVEVLDILPWVGDRGVIDPTARLTEWRPNLITPIQTPAGVTVYYSTATNPCRTDYVAAGPAGCTPANWSTVLPTDPTTIQSLKLDFGTKVLQPGDQIELTWDMRAPVTAPTNNEIAWNSFGFKAKRQDNNDPFLPSEPFKVGIKVKADVNSSYGNFVWLDANKNGIQDAGETGIDGVRVELHKDNGDNVNDPKTDPLIAFTSTANGGLYLFPGLAPGNYYAVFFLPPGYETSPANATSDELDSDGIAGICNGSRVTIAPITNLSATENDLTWDQGIFPAKAAVGNYVWFDENQNNVQDESSANGINGVIVCLYTSTGVFSASTVTTNDVYGRPGYYLFDQLEPGSYYVQFKPTPDKTYTPGSGSQGGSTSDETDSDVDPATGRTATFSLTAGEVDLTWDAGLIIQTGLYKLGNYVWSDANNNGLVDKDEVGLNGVTVNLYNDRNNDGKPQADESVTTTITGTVAGIDGIYTFDRLPAGNYIVQIPDVNFKGVLLDYVSSTGNHPAPDPDNNVENDDNGTSVVDCGIISKPITLSAVAEPLDGGYTNYSVDFGFYKCIKPNYVASVVQPTCAGGLGSISIGGGTIGDKVGYSIGTTFTGSYSTAVAISSLTNGVVVGNIPGSSTDVTYTVRVFNGEEVCYNDFTFTITKLECCVTPTNVVATASPANAATGASITLNATATGISSGTTTYIWSGAGISSPTATTMASRTVVAPAMAGVYTYTVLVSNGVGCEATATVSLTVEIPCAIATTVTPGTCDPATNQYAVSGTISLTSATAGTATITDGAQSTTVTVPAGATSVAYSLTGLTSGTGSHTVTVSLPGCGTATATYNAPASCSVAATITVTSATVCFGNSATLTASGCAGTVTWSNGTSGNTLVTPALTQTTSYTATCTTASATTFAVGTVTVLPQPVLNLSASATLVTVGSNVTLTATGCTGTLTWSNGSTGASIVVMPMLATQTYSATCTTGPACFTTASIVINTEAPANLIVTSATICAGSSATLTAAGCTGSVRWINGTTGNTLVTPALTQTTNYTATCTTATSTTFAVGTVTVNPAVTATISAGSLSICAGQSTTLTASGGASYLWSNGATTATISVSTAGTYSVTATSAAGCSGTATTTVVQNPAPVVSVTSATVCAGSSATLTASGGSTYLWNTGQTTQSIVVSATATTTYSVTGTSSAGCSATAAATVTVLPQPVLNLSASATLVTAGSNVTLTATGCTGSIAWSNGSTGASIVVMPMQTTQTYSATCTTGPACFTTASIVINTEAPANLIVTSATICAGSSATLTAAGCAGTITWSNGTSGNTLVTPDLTQTTSYTATCTTATSTTSAVATVTVLPQPVLNLSASSTLVTAGSNVTLTTTGCTGTVAWSNGSTGASIVVMPMQPTQTYSATCTTGPGCFTTASIVINTEAPASLVVSSATVCHGSSATLTAAGCAGTITWSNGTSGNSLVTPALTQTTSYTATCTTTTSTTSAVATVTVLPQPAVNLSASSTLVTVGSNVTLTATGCTGSIAWSNGSTGASIVVMPMQPTQTYSATCTTGPGCFTTASIVVNTLPPCSASLVVTAGTCQSATNTFSATATLTASNLLQPQSVTLTLGGQSQVFSLTASGENTVQIIVNGLPANGATGTATALFAETACASVSTTFAAPTSCSAAPSVNLEKQVSATVAQLGDVVTYTLTLSNTGPVSATNLVVTDTFSASIAFVPGSVTASTGTFTPNPTGGTWNVATLPTGTTATLVFSVSLVSEGITTNTATLPVSNTIIETKVCTSVPYLVCKGRPFAIRLTVPSGYSRYQWYLTAPGTTTSTLVADGPLNSFTATLPGAYNVVADGGSVGNCNGQSCCQIVIQETEVPLFTLVTQKPTCVGATPQADGQLQITGLPTTGRYQFQYSPTTSFDAASAQPAQATAIPANGVIATNLPEGNYTVRVTDMQTGCFRDVTVGLSANCTCPTNKCVPITVSKIQK